MSGTADLACSTKTEIAFEEAFSVENYGGRNLVFEFVNLQWLQ